MAPQQQRRNRAKIFLKIVFPTNLFLGESIDYSVKLYRRVSLWSSISIEQDDIHLSLANSFDVRPERGSKNRQRYYELELLKRKFVH